MITSTATAPSAVASRASAGYGGLGRLTALPFKTPPLITFGVGSWARTRPEPTNNAKNAIANTDKPFILDASSNLNFTTYRFYLDTVSWHLFLNISPSDPDAPRKFTPGVKQPF